LTSCLLPGWSLCRRVAQFLREARDSMLSLWLQRGSRRFRIP
jgi:hypothetical protein